MTASDIEALSRSATYELLSLAYLYPGDGRAALLRQGTRELASVASGLGWQERARVLEEGARALDGVDDEGLLDQHLGVFGHTISKDCPPYEAEYGQTSIFQKSQTLAEIQGFYRAFGVTPNPDLKDRADHIGVEMEFMHVLTLKEAHAIRNHHDEDKLRLCRRAQARFLAEHLAPWAVLFGRRVSRKVEKGNVYGPISRLLELLMEAEFRAFGIEAAMDGPVPELEPRGAECEALSPALSRVQGVGQP